MRLLRFFPLLLAFLATPPLAHAQSADSSIEAAVAAAPEGMRADATVLGYEGESSELVTLREGSGQLVCLADDPSDDRFHVACYHKSLAPFMERGRVLRREGRSDQVDEIRQAEIESGELSFPDHPASLYSLSGGTFDPEAGEVTGGRSLHVIYTPYATLEETGLPARAPAGQPWLMEPGKPWAHVMIVGKN